MENTTDRWPRLLSSTQQRDMKMKYKDCTRPHGGRMFRLTNEIIHNLGLNISILLNIDLTLIDILLWLVSYFKIALHE